MMTMTFGWHGVAVDDRVRVNAPVLAISAATVRASGPATADLGATADLCATAYLGAAAIRATYAAWRPAQRTLKRHSGTTPAPGTAPGRFA